MQFVLLFGMPGGSEIIVILLVVLLLFGGKKLPEVMRGIAKGIKDVKNTTDSIKKEINDTIDDTKI